MDTNKPNLYDILDRFYQTLNEKDGEKLEGYFTDEAIYDDPDLGIVGLAVRTKSAVVRTLLAHMNSFSQLKIKIDGVLVEGNRATVTWTFQGIITTDLIEKKFSGVDTLWFDNKGKIYQLRSKWNPSDHSYGKIEPVYRD